MGKPDTANMSQEQTKQARKQQRKARAALHSRSRAANAEHFQRTKYKQAAEQSEAQVERLENQMSRASRAHGRTAKLGQRRKAPLQIGGSEQGFLARGPHYGCREGK